MSDAGRTFEARHSVCPYCGVGCGIEYAGNGRGEVTLDAEVTPAVRRGTVFCTFHYADSPANALTGDALDPEARIPEYKHSAVRVEPAG